MRFPRRGIALLFGLVVVSAMAAENHPYGTSPFPYVSGSLRPRSSGSVSREQADLDSATKAFYQRWRADYLTYEAGLSLFPKAFINANGDGKQEGEPAFVSISEGHGYGMLISVVMAGSVPSINSKNDFDSLVRYFKAHPSHPDADTFDTEVHQGLMAFRQSGETLSKMTQAKDEADSASDGDMDIAYALLLADKQWGSTGTINYASEAQAVLQAILDYELKKPEYTISFGDASIGGKLGTATRTSDFMTQHWATFSKAMPAAAGDWTKLRDTTYKVQANVFANYSPYTGLIPDFLELPATKFYPPANLPAILGGDGRPLPVQLYRPPAGKLLEAKTDGKFSYNACRTPWRLATDYLINGDERAVVQLQTLNGWIQRKVGPKAQLAAGRSYKPTRLLYPRGVGDPGLINAGYRLDGVALAPRDHGSNFNGPLAVSAMLPGNQDWLNALWDNLVDADGTSAAEKEEYFRANVKMLCMIVLSGNWWSPTATVNLP